LVNLETKVQTVFMAVMQVLKL